MRNCTHFVIWIKRKITLHSIRRENFFKKLLVVFHFFVLLSCSPGRSSPRYQMLVMNPGFFIAYSQPQKYNIFPDSSETFTIFAAWKKNTYF